MFRCSICFHSASRFNLFVFNLVLVDFRVPRVRSCVCQIDFSKVSILQYLFKLFSLWASFSRIWPSTASTTCSNLTSLCKFLSFIRLRRFLFTNLFVQLVRSWLNLREDLLHSLIFIFLMRFIIFLYLLIAWTDSRWCRTMTLLCTPLVVWRCVTSLRLLSFTWSIVRLCTPLTRTCLSWWVFCFGWKDIYLTGFKCYIRLTFGSSC